MTSLLAASLAFVLLHRLVSGSPLRERIAARLGERRFQASFGLASATGLLWLGAAYATTPPAFREPLWSSPALLWSAQWLLQPLAILLITSGFLAPNPGTVGQEGAVDRPDVVRGVLRITRHPFLWGVALLAAGHMAALPSPRGLLLFGTIGVVALAGTLSIDAKRRRRLGPRWIPFSAATSNLPFAAVLAGRQRLELREIGLKPLLAAALLSVVSVLAHPALLSSLLPF